MKKTTIISVLATLALVSPTTAQNTDTRPGVAVLPFELTDPTDPDLQESGMNFGLQQLLTAELGMSSDLRLIERREISAIMQEMELHGRGNVDASTAADIGRIVGARYMIGGTYFALGGGLEIILRVIDVETTEINPDAWTRISGEPSDARRLLSDAASELIDNLDLPALPQVEVRREEAEQVPARALRLYSAAMRQLESGNRQEALRRVRLVLDDWPDFGDARELEAEISGAG